MTVLFILSATLVVAIASIVIIQRRHLDRVRAETEADPQDLRDDRDWGPIAIKDGEPRNHQPALNVDALVEPPPNGK